MCVDQGNSLYWEYFSHMGKHLEESQFYSWLPKSLRKKISGKVSSPFVNCEIDASPGGCVGVCTY